MAWLYVLFAAVVEVFWVIGLKYSDNLIEWTGTVIAIIFSFYFIIKACETLPSGTVYAVFTGSGAAVIACIDFTLFDAVFSLPKAFFIGLIILGVVGIKVTTDTNEPNVNETKKAGEA
ncbi:DMT family transporter [Virgibacillus sp. W0430]|uniref:DMT family transporter n=1 Tax=Virgibacillus sp. W0430 TaxID=3391580 RepID=UPI003F45B3DC